MPPRTAPARALAALSRSILFLATAGLTACASPPADETTTSLYTLVEGIDGVYFLPPLGPEPAAQGTFEATLLDGLSIVVEADDGAGDVATIATFDASSAPRVALLPDHERYWLGLPAASYLTDPAKTYRIRALLDGADLATSVLSAHAFEVLADNPALIIGVALRIEGSGAVRAVSAARRRTRGTPLHCSDGVQNKDETGVDCGGSHCGPCCTPTAEVCNGLDDDCDGVEDDGDPGGGASCSTGQRGDCAAGTTQCISGALACVGTVAPGSETCNGRDDDCNGVVDDATGCIVPVVQGWTMAGAAQFFAPTQNVVGAEYCAYVATTYHYGICIIMEASDIAYAIGTEPTCTTAGERMVRAFNEYGTCRAGSGAANTSVPWGGMGSAFRATERCPPGTLLRGATNDCRVTNPAIMPPWGP
ncbi:hypothetical protein L6R52_05080 [Myxococcota bacterium]|nr:hypothetical protein [Myxococcota bacterium]